MKSLVFLSLFLLLPRVFLGCADSCLSCASDRCIQCKDGYYLENWECYSCSSNCLSCSADGCEKCEKTSFLKNGICYESIPNCLSCYKQKTYCMNCDYLDWTNTTIYFAFCSSDKCSFCLSNSCGVCKYGFFRENFECFECSVRYERCLHCNETKCISCEYGHQNIKGVCAKECMFGTYQEKSSGLCINCSLKFSGCFSCTEEKCLICRNGFSLDENGKCQKKLATNESNVVSVDDTDSIKDHYALIFGTIFGFIGLCSIISLIYFLHKKRIQQQTLKIQGNTYNISDNRRIVIENCPRIENKNEIFIENSNKKFEELNDVQRAMNKKGLSSIAEEKK